MKNILSVCLIAGSALIASNTITNPSNKSIPDGKDFFTCNVNGNIFTAVANDSSLVTKFTYSNNKHTSPAALFINAEEEQGNKKSYFYIQPVNDDAPTEKLVANNNLYKNFYITYKAVDNTFYNTTTAPGSLEITAIDTVHKVVVGKLNCILYSSTKKDWIIVTDGKFRVKF